MIDGEVSRLEATILTTASKQKENNRFAIKAKNDLIQMGFKTVDFTDIEYERPEKLERYSVLYISGGNPFYLLYHLKRSGADFIIKKLAKQNVVIVGASAGAVILEPNIDLVQFFTPEMNDVGLKDLRALGLTDKTIFPHCDREDLFPDDAGRTIEERLKAFETAHQGAVIRIKDDGFYLINEPFFFQNEGE